MHLDWPTHLGIKPNRFIVAFSGGLDSTVLLHACRQLETPVLAIHVNHQLHPESGTWAAHCARLCAEWDLPYQAAVVSVDCGPGESLEAQARLARYKVFKEAMRAGDMLLTAHHQDDQVETILHHLCRGSGVKGLAGIKACDVFGVGHIARPLLAQTRASLLAYAKGQGLVWIEDPSNEATHFRRNALRHEVLPMLARFYPGVQKAIARTGTHARAAQGLLDTLAEQDLEAIVVPEGLQLPPLCALPIVRQQNVIRAWLDQQGLVMPNTVKLRDFCQALNLGQQAKMHWQGHCLARQQKLVRLL